MTLARQVEDEAVAKFWKYLDAFKRFERPLAFMLRRKYSPEEVLEAEGKRCVIAVRGLKFHDIVIFFQISELSIKQVEPYESYNTFIEAPIKTINLFLARVLSGDEDAFGDLITSNEAKIRGPHTFHDIRIFEEAVSILARNIKQLKGVMK